MSSRKMVLGLSGLSRKEAVRLTSEVQDYCYTVLIDERDAEREIRIRSLRKLVNRVSVNVNLYGEPEVAAERAAEIVREGADIILVHASRGLAMMKAVVERLKEVGRRPTPTVWAVATLPQWLSEEERDYHYDNRRPDQIVLDHALAATKAGAEGVVCLPQDVWKIRKYPDFRGMKLIAVGFVRSVGGVIDDRAGTPRQAVNDGANFIAVDRQVTGARNPVATFISIATEIGLGTYTDKQEVHPQNASLH